MNAQHLTNPAAGGFAVTPSDSAPLANAARGIYVGGTGDLKVDLAGGATLTFAALAAGVLHPLQVRKVYATGTTATNIVAVF